MSDHDVADMRAMDADLAASKEPTRAELYDEYATAFAKVLDVENPIVTATLVNLLNEDDACALFVSYITRLVDSDSTSHVHDGPSTHHCDATMTDDDAAAAPAATVRETDDVTSDLRRSFRATMLLTSDDTSDALITFLPRKSALLTKCIFPVFQPNAQGNLRHACRVIDYLLRMYLDDVYDVIGANAATVERYMAPMLAYIDHAYVAEAFLTMVCKPHTAALMRFYASAPQKKWAFFRALSEWKLLLVLADHVSNSAYSETHNVGAADVFVELLDRLAADDNGELLLQPAAYCPELLENLVLAAVDANATRTIEQRTGAIKCVLRLLQKATHDKVQGPPTSPYQSFGGTIVNLVANQLAPLRQKIFALGEQHLGTLVDFLVATFQEQQSISMDLTSNKPLPIGAVRHTAYVVKVPFTEFRLTLVEVLVELVAYNPPQLSVHFDAHVWRVLVSWFFEYAHNNLYHAAFYQLLFIALRTDNQVALEALVKKQKLVTLLIEHYRHDGAGASNRGYILQCCNAIRLQAAAQPPDAFLRNFLQSHTTWRQFDAELRSVTLHASVAGLGFNVPQLSRPGTMFQKDSWHLLSGAGSGNGADDHDGAGIDHGSEFARSLGFIDDVAWPDDSSNSTIGSGGGDGSGSKKKKKKKRSNKKKTATSDSNGSVAESTDDDHDHDHDHDGDGDHDADHEEDDDEEDARGASSERSAAAVNGSRDTARDELGDDDNGNDADDVDDDARVGSSPSASPSASPKKPKSKKKKKHKK